MEQFLARVTPAERQQLVAAMRAGALAEVGVRYLSMNISPHHGEYPFGRSLIPFHWEATSGKKLLAWLQKIGYPYDFLPLMGSVRRLPNSHRTRIVRQEPEKDVSEGLLKAASAAGTLSGSSVGYNGPRTGEAT